MRVYVIFLAKTISWYSPYTNSGLKLEESKKWGTGLVGLQVGKRRR